MIKKTHFHSNGWWKCMCLVASPNGPIIWKPQIGVPTQVEKVSWMISLRFLITTHFLAWHDVVTISLECLSSATYVLVKSSLRKILLGRENNFLLALRARSWLVSNLNQRTRVELDPSRTQAKLYQVSYKGYLDYPWEIRFQPTWGLRMVEVEGTFLLWDSIPMPS